MILDHTNHSDILNLLFALEWHIPDSYWRLRFPKDVIYEVGDDVEAANWPSFCAVAERLVENCEDFDSQGDIAEIQMGEGILRWDSGG